MLREIQKMLNDERKKNESQEAMVGSHLSVYSLFLRAISQYVAEPCFYDSLEPARK